MYYKMKTMNNTGVQTLCILFCCLISCGSQNNDGGAESLPLRDEGVNAAPLHSQTPLYECNYLDQTPPGDLPELLSPFRGRQGFSDLFISFRDPGGRWTQPENLGPRINSPAKDEYPFVTPDGKYLFFNSNRISEINRSRIQDGPGNMYWVSADIIEAMRRD